jgi:hypothetical protein
MALNKSSQSKQPWPAADDDKIKFSEFDRAVETVVRYGASVMARPLWRATSVRTARAACGNP